MLWSALLGPALVMPSGVYQGSIRWPVRQMVTVRISRDTSTPRRASLSLDGFMQLDETQFDIDEDAAWITQIPPEVDALLRRRRCTFEQLQYFPVTDEARVVIRAPVVGTHALLLKRVPADESTM